MLYSDNFLNELRNIVKEMLLNGDIPQISQVKELLEYSNIEFGDFIAPMLKDDVCVSENSDNNITNEMVGIDIESVPNNVVVSKQDGSILHFPVKNTTVVTSESRHGHCAEDGTYTELPIETSPQVVYLEPKEEETPKPKYMTYFHNTSSAGKLEGVVIYKLRAFIVEDLVTGQLLYKNTHHVARGLGLMHGEVISFNLDDLGRMCDNTREDTYSLERRRWVLRSN